MTRRSYYEAGNISSLLSFIGSRARRNFAYSKNADTLAVFLRKYAFLH